MRHRIVSERTYEYILSLHSEQAENFDCDVSAKLGREC